MRPSAVQGPTLVLLHGWMGEKADWSPVIEHFKTIGQGSVLTIDLPGHGDTEARALEGLYHVCPGP